MHARPRGFRRLLAGAALLGLLGLGALCCEQVLSIDGAVQIQGADGATDAPSEGSADGPVTDAGPGEAGMKCGISVPDDAGCGSCMAEHCCSQMSACAGDENKQCLLLESCLLACGTDDPCRSACVVANPVGAQPDIPAVDTCAATFCRDECGMPCGQSGLFTTPPDAATACETCMQDPTKGACNATLACATNLDCQTSGYCAKACATPDCRLACANDGGLLFDAVFAGLQCYTPCRVGQNWTCQGSIRWPQVDAGSQQATLIVDDALSVTTPVPGVSAEACKSTDDGCTSPLSTGMGNDAGVVALPGLGPAIIFGFEGHFEMSAPGYVDTFYYLSFPLSQANAQVPVAMMKQADLASAMAGVSIPAIPGRGTVWAQVQDCLLIPASNAVVKADGLDPSSVIYYANGTPSLTATSTDFSGSAFIYNVPPGPLTLRAIPNDTGIESSMVAVHVEADAMTSVTLLPTAQP